MSFGDLVFGRLGIHNLLNFDLDLDFFCNLHVPDIILRRVSRQSLDSENLKKKIRKACTNENNFPVSKRFFGMKTYQSILIILKFLYVFSSKDERMFGNTISLICSQRF